MEKATIRIVRTSEWKGFTNQKSRQEFTLYGTVLKLSEGANSVLVQKGGSKTTFWLSISDKENLKQLHIGSSYKFLITISSYISKSHSIYTTSLTITDAWLLNEKEDQEQLLLGFDNPVIPVNIVSSHKTEIPGLYMIHAIRMKDGEEMESYYMRYWSPDKAHADMGTAMIKFTVKKYENMIDHKGISQTMLESRTITNSDGEEVTVETPKYQLGLNILEIIR